MKKVLSLLVTGIFCAGIHSCKDDVQTPPKVTITAPVTDKKYKPNLPITLKASLYDKTGLASAKLFVNSAWEEEVIFADTEENLGGAESLEYTTTFTIDSLINYPKAAYMVKLSVADMDGNVKTQQVQISLAP